jgi:hypothetical protein
VTDQPIVYVARPLNGHRRHQTSVTHALAKSKHYEEILAMHAFTGKYVKVDKASRSKREAHLREVRRYLGMSDATSR